MSTETVDTATGEVAVRTVGEVLEAGHLPAEQVAIVNEFLTAAMPEQEEDPAAAALSIVAQVLAAETPEEVLADVEATGLRQFLNRPFTLERVEFRRSEFEAGMPFYALLRGHEQPSGEEVLLTTGSQKITAQVFRLVERGWLPRTVECRQADKPSRNGYYPLRLVDAKP